MRIAKLLRMLLALLLFLLLLGCGGGGSDDGSSDDSDNSGNTTAETSELKTAVTSVEDAFASNNPQQVLSVMSDESKAVYQENISDIQDKMVDFGKDFKNRKLIYATDNYAEYEFTADGEKYTVTFSRQDDGTWKLTRF